MKNPYFTEFRGWGLKGVESCQGDEGVAWSAAITLYGKKVGQVRDDGNGGSLTVRLDDPSLHKTLELEERAFFGDRYFEPGGLFSHVADNMDAMKTVKKAARGYIVLLLEDNLASGDLTTLQRSGGALYDATLHEEVAAYMERKHPGKPYFNFSAYLARLIDSDGNPMGRPGLRQRG